MSPSSQAAHPWAVLAVQPIKSVYYRQILGVPSRRVILEGNY